MGGCQNYGPFSGPLNTRCRILLSIQKGTIVLTTTHILGAIGLAWQENQSLDEAADRFAQKLSAGRSGTGARLREVHYSGCP